MQQIAAWTRCGLARAVGRAVATSGAASLRCALACAAVGAAAWRARCHGGRRLRCGCDGCVGAACARTAGRCCTRWSSIGSCRLVRACICLLAHLNVPTAQLCCMVCFDDCCRLKLLGRIARARPWLSIAGDAIVCLNCGVEARAPHRAIHEQKRRNNAVLPEASTLPCDCARSLTWPTRVERQAQRARWLLPFCHDRNNDSRRAPSNDRS